MRARATLVALGLVLAAAGCGDSHHGDSATANAADAAFLNDMTAHHQGAIDMAQLAESRAEHPEIRRLAVGIETTQKAEIAAFERMHERMRSMHDDATHGGHMGMSDAEMGMDMDMDALAAAKPFDKAFIDEMIPHHRGAIVMARELLAKGADPELRKMAQAIIDAQSKEIAQMRSWRKRWYQGAP